MRILLACVVGLALSVPAYAHVCPHDPRCLDKLYGAGSPNKADGINDPYSQYGSQYSNKSAKNPDATDAPKLYDKPSIHGSTSIARHTL